MNLLSEAGGPETTGRISDKASGQQRSEPAGGCGVWGVHFARRVLRTCPAGCCESHSSLLGRSLCAGLCPVQGSPVKWGWREAPEGNWSPGGDEASHRDHTAESGSGACRPSPGSGGHRCFQVASVAPTVAVVPGTVLGAEHAAGSRNTGSSRREFIHSLEDQEGE